MIRRKPTPKRECSTCAKQHTMGCPNSYECYSTEDKPHWKPKEAFK